MSAFPSTDDSWMESLAKAGLESQMVLPTSTEYATRLNSYFSNSAKLQPAGFVRPRSAADVAVAVKALADSGQSFAVLSGGCTQWAGSNGIAKGVTIDLGLMDSVDFNSAFEHAHIGPGALWGKVYSELEKHGRVVAGGRDATVGVAGLILGGGNNLLAAHHGFTCDTVVAYEVVLADGRIITASATEHQDLFCALKGGGHNFGVVTRFTMRTMPSSLIWGGRAVLPETAQPQVADALADFTANISQNPDSIMICARCTMPRFRDMGLDAAFSNIYFNTANVERPTAFEKWFALPEIVNTCKSTTLLDMLGNVSLPRDYYNVWFTLTVKNDPSIINKAFELHKDLVKKMDGKISNGDFVSMCIFQPVPRIFSERSVAAGGNVMGFERNRHDGILLQIIAMVRTTELEAWVRPHVETWIDGVRVFARTIDDGLLPWTYLNYADPSQEVLQSYGPENVLKIRQAAAKYDPSGIFQRLCPGGFKISAVKD